MASRSSRSSSRTIVSLLVVLALAAGAFLSQRVSQRAPTDQSPTESPSAPASGRDRSGTFGGREALLRASRERRSNLLVEVGGRVVRVLRDDREGSPHQRFLLRVADSVTLLVAHNLELAPRVPLEPGDSVTVGGEYEWNSKGGVFHWTHDDPARRHPDGFIRHEGRVYQ